ncbi:NAD(P)-dependent oxidoreductase [Alicyclobacillus mali]|uniref:NAD(P)-dependent oxidoreductase n=1 Tax=Alicyclobacillus mali (ex Roth et al. 2021) TaxID=1123961 RepID=A0ABS0F673_9BACL|nr:NAD(P)-dependent oxidoreductase [Alicyclobacillus mali (ex Roth et al. 2021)]MBF8378801.1 NAD(P)-dependent oxidoreductase [Alicyclobacillus mali (ex Roth et al. 2021)]
MTIGWMGLGLMGERMVKRVAALGEDVIAYNRSPKTIQDLPANVRVTQNPLEAVQGCRFTFVMLADAGAVEAALFDSGAIDAAGTGSIVVNMSTVGVEDSIRLAARVEGRGVGYVESPVLGTTKPAEEGKLVALVAGREAIVEAALPYLRTMAHVIHRLGNVGNGAAMKLMVNYLLATSMLSLGEALAFADRAGFDVHTALDVLATSSVWPGVYAGKRGMIEAKDFAPQFPVKHLAKDVRLFTEASEHWRARTPIAGLARDLLRRASAGTFADLDMAALSAWFRDDRQDQT